MKQISLTIGTEIPNFSCATHLGNINFWDCVVHQFSMIVVLNCRNAVSTTEVGALAKLKKHFEERGVVLVGLTIGSVNEVQKWAKDIDALEDCGHISFPIVCDDSSVSFLHINAI